MAQQLAQTDFDGKAARHVLDAPSNSGPTRVLSSVLSLPVDQQLRFLDSRAELLKLFSQQGSKASVASGMRVWHSFATSCLAYAENNTLPPSSAEDVMRFIALFARAGTAKNYVGYVAWACKFKGLQLSWYNQEVQLVLQGLKKLEVAKNSQVLRDRLLMTSDLLLRMLRVAGSMEGFQRDCALWVLSFQALLRVQSEGVPAEKGASHELHSLPEGRHSALIVDDQGNLQLRLRRRKNLPAGSLLQRPCICAGTRHPLCPGHALMDVWQNFQVGERLFNFTAAHALNRFRKVLQLLDVPGAALFTFKCFRAGKAVELASQGQPLHVIMHQGQWRSAALLAYVTSDQLDSSVFLRSALSEDGDDD